MADKEYIERDEAIRTAIDACIKVVSHGITQFDAVDIAEMIETIPTADVEVVRHGKWKFNKDGSGTCNQCGFTQKNVWDYDSWQHYCGVCGAKMGGKDKQ